MDGPGRRTREPVPNEMTGNPVGAVERRRCASIERLLLDAQTVQNLSLKEGGEEVGAGVVVFAVAVAVVVSVDSAMTASGGVCVCSGGGGGGGGGVLVAMVGVWEEIETK
jgi:hypothetical protein